MEVIIAPSLVLNFLVVLYSAKRFRALRKPAYLMVVAVFTAGMITALAGLFYLFLTYSGLNDVVPGAAIYSILIAAEPYYVVGVIAIGTIANLKVGK